MAKPDPEQILKDANKLKDDRFVKRNNMLQNRAKERFNETKIELPKAYDKTAHRHRSQIIEDEGRQIGTLVHSDPIPHIPAGTPEVQPLTTKCEKFLMAWEQECLNVFGPTRWQGTLAQVHDNISWEYVGWKKAPYAGQPKAPGDDADIVTKVEYGMKNESYKQDQGVKGYTDRRYVPTNTMYPQGNVYDPDRVYEIRRSAPPSMIPPKNLMSPAPASIRIG